MGNLYSLLGYENKKDDDPSWDVPDPATALTPRHKKAIREAWDIVKKDVRGNGVAFFVYFFTEFPEYQKHFKGFADVPLADLPNNKKLHAHAFSVMYAITSMVDNLDDVDTLSVILMKTGQNHKNRNLSIKEFQNLGIVFSAFLEKQLGSTYFTGVHKEAWVKLFDAMNSIIKQGMEKVPEK